MIKKMGFWSVFSLVTGSQIGSSVFTMPSYLAGYGYYALLGFIVAGVGAMALGLVFSELCSHYPNTGGPAVYIHKEFGEHYAFFGGWTYWVISWVSTTAVVITAVGYIQACIGGQFASLTTIILQCFLVFVITAINLKGVYIAGKIESFLSLLKVLPLLLLPFFSFFFINPSYLEVAPSLLEQSPKNILSHVVLLALWGFVGVELATTPAKSVSNPQKTIPRAILWGTFCVAFLYIMNIVAVMGVVPASVLAYSTSPYVDLCQALFSGSGYLFVAFLAAVVCIGSINAWVLSSGQIALGLAQEGFLPRFFAKTTTEGAPIYGIIISSLGMIPLLFLTHHGNFVDQLREIIEVSVTAFIFVYILSCLAFLKLCLREKCPCWKTSIGFMALLFCVWILLNTEVQTLWRAALFVVSGVFLYGGWYLRARHSQRS
jgi:basic amino acid/polyamine antiporter, APA family